jgi:hypothetical protein
MLDEFTPVVTQIKGNGRASGNTAAREIRRRCASIFYKKYLKPSVY